MTSIANKVVTQHKLQVKILTEFLNELHFDHNKKKRIQELLCPYCYYIPAKPLGEASTCLLCPSPTSRGNRLCYACAATHHVCVHCGGHLDMKIHKEDPV